MKGFFGEFKKFIMRGNVIDLAVGVIIGGAFQAIVNSLVNDVISPLIGMIGGTDFSAYSVVLKEAVTDPKTGEIPEGIAAQAERSCANVGAILEAAGTDFTKVFKTTCFLADMSDFAAFNEVYAKYFVSRPARSCVAVKTLPKGVLCEIEAIAEK